MRSNPSHLNTVEKVANCEYGGEDAAKCTTLPYILNSTLQVHQRFGNLL